MSDRTLTVKEAAGRFGVTQHTVLSWIRSGELPAIDVSRKRGGRPSWRITPDALARFERARTAMPAPEPIRKQRKCAAVKDPGFVEYF